MEVSTSPKRHTTIRPNVTSLSTRTTNYTFIKPTKGCSTPRTHSHLQMEQTHSQACTKSEHNMLNPELISPVACSMAKKRRAILIKCSKAKNKPPSRDQNKRQLPFTASLVPKKSSQGSKILCAPEAGHPQQPYRKRVWWVVSRHKDRSVHENWTKLSRNNQKYEQKTYTRFWQFCSIGLNFFNRKEFNTCHIQVKNSTLSNQSLKNLKTEQQQRQC